MKYLLFFVMLSFFTTGCGLREREERLEMKTAEINKKEQELLLKEKSLQLREEELVARERLLDSTTNIADSFFVRNPKLPGKWNATMRCIETTCPGSAVGDTKIEQWEISYENYQIVAKAYSNDKLVRVYSGKSDGSVVELSTAPDNPDPALSTKMIVRLQEIKEDEVKGQREIVRPDNCHIMYSLELKRL